MTSPFSDMRSSSKFFDVVLFLLQSLVTGPNFISIVLELWQFSFIRDLTRNMEFRNTPIWVLPNIWRLAQVGNTKFGANVSNKILLNTAKCQGYSFTRFCVIKGKPTVGGKLPPTQIRANIRSGIWRMSGIRSCNLLHICVAVIIFALRLLFRNGSGKKHNNSWHDKWGHLNLILYYCWILQTRMHDAFFVLRVLFLFFSFF